MQSKCGGENVAKVKLSAMTLEPSTLTVEVDEIVEWTIGRNDSQYSSVYKPGERYFILAIKELGIESDKLYTGKSFSHKFENPGSYTITCLNYPGIKQKVKVTLPWRVAHNQKIQRFTESRNGTDETSDNLRSPRDASKERKESMSSSAAKEEEPLDDVNRCLKMFINGSSEEQIKDSFKHMFNSGRKLTFEYPKEGSDDEEKPSTPTELPLLKKSRSVYYHRVKHERSLQNAYREVCSNEGGYC